MGNIDSIPGISQVKSLVQVIDGDEDGARETQENFVKQGLPMVTEAILNQAISRGRRSINDDVSRPYDTNLPDLPDEFSLKLPGSIKDIQFNETMSPQAAIDMVFSVFFILKLMGLGHIRSKPYYDEMCQSFYPTMMLVYCEDMLFQTFNKYEHHEEVKPDDFAMFEHKKIALFASIVDSLEFESYTLSKHSVIGQLIETSACGDSEECINDVEIKLTSLKKLEQFLLSNIKKTRRKKRSILQKFFGAPGGQKFGMKWNGKKNGKSTTLVVVK